MKKLIALFFPLLLVGFAQAQHQKCATMEVDHRLRQTDPEYALRRTAIDQHAKEFELTSQGNTSRAVYTIPVVFHVVYRTNSENISDAALMSQLDILNEDYSKMNLNFSQTPSVFQGVAANFEIQFCLANVDPQGSPTTGITRTVTTKTNFASSSDDDKIKFTAQGGKDGWNRNKYLNIWVCNLGTQILGYAQFPGGPANTDGVVLTYTSVGRAPANAFNTPYNMGRTATHEIGHWLNLYHIWGNENSGCGNAPGSSGTDEVDDTPVQDQANYQCPSFPSVSCNNGPNGDMFMNYMDYMDDACATMFTAGQKARSRALFSVGGSRVSLLTANVCNATPPQPTQACGDTLRFPLSGTIVIYGDQQTGYVTGTNIYRDSVKAEKYTAVSPYTLISGALFDFYDAQANGNPNQQVTFRVYDDDGAGGLPGTILGSTTFPLSTIIANVADAALTNITFPQPVVVSGNFYLGYVVNPASGMVLALYSNTNGNSNPNTAYEQASNGAWHAFTENPASWGLSISMGIYPILTSPPPTVGFSVNDNSICTGSSVTYTSSGNGSAPYLWTFPGGEPSSSTQANPTVIYNNPGTFGATFLANGNCSGQTATLNQPLVVTVTNAGFTPLITNNSGVLSSGVTSGVFQWLLNGQAISGANGSSFTPTVNGTYTVRVSGNGCNVLSQPFVLTVLGIPTTGISKVTLFPNPADQSISIQTAYLDFQETLNVKLVDLSGKLILSRSFSGVAVQTALQLDVSRISNGSYLVVIESKAGRQVGSIVIAH